jgi:hypothetical protein
MHGMADRRNFALATVSQTNKAGDSAKLIDRPHVADGITKYNKAASVISYNQTMSEAKLGLARLFQCKGRSGVGGDRFVTMISQNYSIGQFAFDSVLMNPTSWDAIVSSGGNDDS